MGAGSFRLDAAQRSDLERLVRGCGVKDWGKALSELHKRVESSIVAWMELKALQVTPQDVVQLSGLVALLTAFSQPSIGLIRTRVAALSLGIVREIEGRASRLSDHAPRFHPIGLGLKTWARGAKSVELVTLLTGCLIQGGQFVAGRNRPKGKKSAPRFEASAAARPNTPMNREGCAGGRPTRDDLWTLISYLAIDWLLSTGRQPDKGRSDKTPFGALAFMVFRWISEGEKAAHSLRTYWNRPKPRPKKKKSAALSQG